MKNKIKIQANQVDIYASQVVLFNDYEMADMVNPNGEIYGFCSQLQITLDNGRRFLHNHVETGGRWDSEEKVAELSQKLLLRVQESGVVNLDHWCEVEARYGSEAWQSQDAERHQNFTFAKARNDIESMERFG